MCHDLVLIKGVNLFLDLILVRISILHLYLNLLIEDLGLHPLVMDFSNARLLDLLHVLATFFLLLDCFVMLDLLPLKSVL